MSLTIKLFIVFFFSTISTVMNAIAFGRQKAWAESLNKWDCYSSRPPEPDIMESLSSVSVSLWLASIVIPLILGLMFVFTSQTQKSLFFWIPIACCFLLIRLSELTNSFKPLGYCGSKDELSMGYGLFEGGLLLFTVLSVCIFFIGKALFSLFGKKT